MAAPRTTRTETPAETPDVETPDADAPETPTETPLAVDIETLSDDVLAELINRASKVKAEREAEQRLADAMASVPETVEEISFDDILAAAADNDAPQVVAGLMAISTAINGLRVRITGAAGLPVGRPVTLRNGNGGSGRASRIRDQIAAVFAEHSEADFSVAELAHELPDAPTGKPVSTGAVQVALMGGDGNGGMVAAGQAMCTQESPRRFKGVTPAAPVTAA